MPLPLIGAAAATVGGAVLRWLVPSAAVALVGHGIRNAGEGIESSAEAVEAGGRSLVLLAGAAVAGAAAMRYYDSRKPRGRR